MRNIKLIIQYIGTHYYGWQVQPQGPTIQSTLQEILQRILGEKITLIGSGRTDSGVHAFAQVAHFKTENMMDISIMRRALNGLLPESIAVLSVEEASLDFHAMRHAISKKYTYFILNSPQKYPFLTHYTWQCHRTLNLQAITACLNLLVGKQDFAAFCASDAEVKTTVRDLLAANLTCLSMEEFAQTLGACFGIPGFDNHARPQARLQELSPLPCEGEGARRAGEGASNILAFSFHGKGFLKHMIRNIMGTLVDVGKNKTSMEEFKRIMASKDRRQAGRAAPAKGLFLVEVEYGVKNLNY